MATYPDLPTSYGGDPEPLKMLEVDRAEDGTARVRSLGADKAHFSLEHPRLTEAQRDTMVAFYAANRLLVFDYTSKSDGATRSCIFAAAPTYQRLSGNRYTVRVEVDQV